MDTYDSDSDLDDQQSGVATSVLLGYASKEPTDDTISQLGGTPSWIDPQQAPSAAWAQCRTCSNHMALLLQLNGEIPERFPGHERRLYIWACRRKTCQGKPGSVRVLRATRAKESEQKPKQKPAASEPKVEAKAKQDIGAALFGSKPTGQQGNPFSAGNPFSSSPASSGSNPFSSTPAPASTLAAKPPQRPDEETLPQTFAEKARISGPEPATEATNTVPQIPWPEFEANPFPRFYLDAEYEWLDGDDSNDKSKSAHHAAFMDVDATEGSSSGGGGSSSKEDKMLYEDSIDKTFQRFADTLSQNPDQVLRYEFAGQPLLYSRTDAAGVQLMGPPHASGAGASVKTRGAGMPGCSRCGAERVFEVQLTPHAIAELEGDAASLGEGMEWGTIIVGVCGADCARDGGRDVADGRTVAYAEEWAGVQWEEVVDRRRK